MHIVTLGSKDHPRYAIQQGPLVWDGKEWTQTNRPLLFYNPVDVRKELKNLKRRQIKGKNKTKYTATVDIEVYSDEPLSEQQLKDYLTHTAKLSLNTPAPNGSVAHVSIDWNTMKKETSPENQTEK